jgi:hypothetical protein
MEVFPAIKMYLCLSGGMVTFWSIHGTPHRVVSLLSAASMDWMEVRNGVGSTGLDFFRDGTAKPVSVQTHPASPSDLTGGIDVTLPNGAKEHWWYDPIDGFIRRQQDYAYAGGGYDTPSERLGHVPSGAIVSLAPNDSPTSDDHFGNRTLSPEGASAPNRHQSAPGATKKPMRYLSGRSAGISGASPFDTGAPPVPFVPAPAPPASINDRYGMPSPVGAPLDLDQAQPQSGGAMQPASKASRRLSSRFDMPNRNDARPARASTLDNPSPPAQTGWPPASRPTPDYPIPPMVYGLPDPSATSGDNMDDWFARWVKPLLQQ